MRTKDYIKDLVEEHNKDLNSAMYYFIGLVENFKEDNDLKKFLKEYEKLKCEYLSLTRETHLLNHIYDELLDFENCERKLNEEECCEDYEDGE